MLSIFVVDHQAQARSTLVEMLTQLIATSSAHLKLFPRFSIKPIAPQELKFHASPDICILGKGLLKAELRELKEIRQLLPDIVILGFTDQEDPGLATIEQLARAGLDDLLCESISAGDFLKRIIMLVKRGAQSGKGKLIVVDGGKGGVGVTSVAAALAECLALQGKKTAVIDFDFETQDLTRFLQVRPFLNEQLQLIFEGNRAITEDFVTECASKVWEDEERLYCIAPLPESDSLYDPASDCGRTLVSFLEYLDSIFDCVIVDCGAARGTITKALYRSADLGVCVVSDDPAALYAGVRKSQQFAEQIAPSASFVVVQNCVQRTAVGREFLRREFCRAAKLREENLLSESLEFTPAGKNWPGSGATLFSLASSANKQFFAALFERAFPGENAQSLVEENRMTKALKNITQRLQSIRSKRAGFSTELQNHQAPQSVVQLPKMAEQKEIGYQRASDGPRLSLPSPEQLVSSVKLQDVQETVTEWQGRTSGAVLHAAFSTRQSSKPQTEVRSAALEESDLVSKVRFG